MEHFQESSDHWSHNEIKRLYSSFSQKKEIWKQSGW